MNTADSQADHESTDHGHRTTGLLDEDGRNNRTAEHRDEIMADQFKIHILTQEIQEGQPWIVVIGTLGSTPIGTCLMNDWTREVPYINGLVVQRKHRSKGYGSQIIKACIEHCRKAGKQAVGINAYTTSKRSIALYKRLGFKPSLMGNDGSSIWLSVPLEAA